MHNEPCPTSCAEPQRQALSKLSQNDDILQTQNSTINLGSKSLVVAGLTGVSRISGLARDIVISMVFGASGVADAFFLAFRIPNFFRRILAEGAFAQAFVPVLAEQQERHAIEELQIFVRTVAGNFGLVLLAFCIVGTLLAPALVWLFTLGGWSDDPREALAIEMVRIMFPYLGLISFTAFASAVLNSFNRFAVPAFTPVLLNVCVITGALAFASYFAQPVHVLAWAVIVSGVLQFAFHTPSLAALRLLRWPRMDWSYPPVRKVLKLLGPAAYAASAGQVNILVGTILASQLVVGSVSWLYYAERLFNLPIGMIAIAVQTVLLPRLSRLHSQEDDGGFLRSVDWGVRAMILVGLPASVGLYWIARPLTSTFFFHGNFTSHDMEMVAVALEMFALGVLPFMLTRVLAPGFFARQDTATPFRYATISVGVNIIVSLCLFQIIGHIGIALATSVAAFVNCGLLANGLWRRDDFVLDRKLLKTCVAATLGCILMVFAIELVDAGAIVWESGTTVDRILQLALLVVTAKVVYCIALLVFGIRPKDFLVRE